MSSEPTSVACWGRLIRRSYALHPTEAAAAATHGKRKPRRAADGQRGGVVMTDPGSLPVGYRKHAPYEPGRHGVPSVQMAPVRFEPVKTAPSMFASRRSAPVRSEFKNSTSCRKAPERFAPTSPAFSKRDPCK